MVSKPRLQVRKGLLPRPEEDVIQGFIDSQLGDTQDHTIYDLGEDWQDLGFMTMSPRHWQRREFVQRARLNTHQNLS